MSWWKGGAAGAREVASALNWEVITCEDEDGTRKTGKGVTGRSRCRPEKARVGFSAV